MEKNYKLQIKHVNKLFDNGDGIKDICIDIEEGEMLTILGPSGCGKSTLLRTLGGFAPIDNGQIVIDGKEVQDSPPEKRPTAMVFQSYNLWPHMTVYENLAFGLKIKKMPKSEQATRIPKMLELVGMADHIKKYPTQLSGGQQQRVAIARALLLEPAVLLLDEPFSALDAKIRTQMREELKRIQQGLNITVVFVTHDQEEAMAISDRIVVMNKGVVEQIGKPTDIYDTPISRYVASFIGEMNFLTQGENTLAVRPEDVILFPEGTDKNRKEYVGIVETIMILGHYINVGLDVEGMKIHSYIPRLHHFDLSISGKVPFTFEKYHTYNNEKGDLVS